MRILLIDVHYEKDTKPLHAISGTLGELAVLTPAKHNLEFLNIAEPVEINYTEDYGLVGISTVTPSSIYAYQIADEFRKHGKTVVLGGYHPTALPLEAKKHADSVVIGEATLTWPLLLKDYENGKLKPFYKCIDPVDPKLIPNPNREILNNKGFTQTVTATKGCPFGCKFCSIYHRHFGNIFRKKPIDKVIEDIKSIKDKQFFFSDPSLTIDVEYTKELFKKMKDLKKSFSCFGNINILGKDEELLELSREAGCVIWHVGFESISQNALKMMNKKTNKVTDYVKSIEKVNDYGMNILGEFIFGFDTDKKDIFKKTEEVIKDWNITPGFQILTPYPGSPLFDQLKKEGRILTFDWSEYRVNNIVFEPKNMSPDYLKNEVKKIYLKFYSKKYMIKRIIKSMRYGFAPFKSCLYTNISISRKK